MKRPGPTAGASMSVPLAGHDYRFKDDEMYGNKDILDEDDIWQYSVRLYRH